MDDIADGEELPLVCAANTDRRRCSSVLWQDGHSGVSLPRTSNSNSLAHSLHAYSNSGMGSMISGMVGPAIAVGAMN